MFDPDDLRHLLAKTDSVAHEDLLAQLAAAIGHILDRQPDAMVQIAYRLDLNEEAFAAALRQADPAAALASLVLERQLAKRQSKAATPPADRRAADEDLRW